MTSYCFMTYCVMFCQTEGFFYISYWSGNMSRFLVLITQQRLICHAHWLCYGGWGPCPPSISNFNITPKSVAWKELTLTRLSPHPPPRPTERRGTLSYGESSLFLRVSCITPYLLLFPMFPILPISGIFCYRWHMNHELSASGPTRPFPVCRHPLPPTPDGT